MIDLFNSYCIAKSAHVWNSKIRALRQKKTYTEYCGMYYISYQYYSRKRALHDKSDFPEVTHRNSHYK